jgi:hypothetical protein
VALVGSKARCLSSALFFGFFLGVCLAVALFGQFGLGFSGFQGVFYGLLFGYLGILSYVLGGASCFFDIYNITYKKKKKKQTNKHFIWNIKIFMKRRMRNKHSTEEKRTYRNTCSLTHLAHMISDPKHSISCS